jgi:hypothetical protein
MLVEIDCDQAPPKRVRDCPFRNPVFERRWMNVHMDNT